MKWKEKAVDSAGNPLHCTLSHVLWRLFCENEKMEKHNRVEFPFCLAARRARAGVAPSLPSPQFCTNFMRHSGIKTGAALAEWGGLGRRRHGMGFNCLALSMRAEAGGCLNWIFRVQILPDSVALRKVRFLIFCAMQCYSCRRESWLG